MDLIKLKYFYTTAKLEHISLAAKELLISQPALSKAITNLESELKMDLFLRKGKRIVLNENGKFLYDRAERIFSKLCSLESSIAEKKGEGEGSVSIVTTLPYTFTNILDEFMNKYPNVKCQQVRLSNDNLKGFIEKGKYDICITTEKIEHSNVEWVPLFDEEIYLSVPRTWKEANMDTIDLMELKGLSFIGLTNQYKFRQFTDFFCQRIGYTPVYQVEVEEATTILQLVKNGRGVAFTPETAIDLYDDRIKHLKISNGKFTRTIELLKHKYIYPTKISKAFIHHCNDYFLNKRERSST